jgi:hypothetical protein
VTTTARCRQALYCVSVEKIIISIILLGIEQMTVSVLENRTASSSKKEEENGDNKRRWMPASTLPLPVEFDVYHIIQFLDKNAPKSEILFLVNGSCC